MLAMEYVERDLEPVAADPVLVALGPSLWSQADPLQQLLGGEYLITDVLDLPSGRSTEPSIEILGSSDYPEGEVFVHDRGGLRVIVVGHRRGRNVADDAPLPPEVVAAIRALSLTA
jgi:hypothetical protein